MSEQINWAKLTQQGRCKAPGIPWTDEEMEAIYQKGMTADEVRAGLLDPKDKGKKLESREELEERAKKVGIKFDADVVSDRVNIKLSVLKFVMMPVCRSSNKIQVLSGRVEKSLA